MKQSSFKNIEKQSYLLFFKDGIIELLFGVIFIVYAINTWFDSQELFRPIWLRILIVPAAIILALIKEWITKPRLGKVSFSKQRKKRSKWLLFILIIIQIITLIAYIFSSKGIILPEDKISFYSLLVEFIFLIGVLYLVTWFTGYPTFFIAGLVFAFSTPFLLLLNPELHQSYIRIGMMLTASFSFCIFGIIRFVQFLKTYPNPQSNE